MDATAQRYYLNAGAADRQSLVSLTLNLGRTR